MKTIFLIASILFTSVIYAQEPVKPSLTCGMGSGRLAWGKDRIRCSGEGVSATDYDYNGNQVVAGLKLKVHVKASYLPWKEDHYETVEIANLPASLSQLKNYSNEDFWSTPFVADAIAKQTGTKEYSPDEIVTMSLKQPLAITEYVPPPATDYHPARRPPLKPFNPPQPSHDKSDSPGAVD